MNAFEIICLIIGCLFAIIFLFLLAPTLCICLCVFSRKEIEPMNELNMKNTPYEPYAPAILRGSYLLKCIPTQEINVTATDGVNLVADFADGGFEKTAILVHGYRASPVNNFHTLGNLLHQNGYNLLMVHQRGHGKSGGKITHLCMREDLDVLSWLTWAKQNIPTHAIVLCGVSMGATSIAMASDRIDGDQVKALFLDCGYTDLRGQMSRNMAQYIAPKIVLETSRIFLKLALNEDVNCSTVHRLKQNKIPTFFLHCEGDTSVPISCTLANYAACASEKVCEIVPNGSHTTALIEGGKPLQNTVLAFLDKHCKVN